MFSDFQDIFVSVWEVLIRRQSRFKFFFLKVVERKSADIGLGYMISCNSVFLNIVLDWSWTSSMWWETLLSFSSQHLASSITLAGGSVGPRPPAEGQDVACRWVYYTWGRHVGFPATLPNTWRADEERKKTRERERQRGYFSFTL